MPYLIIVGHSQFSTENIFKCVRFRKHFFWKIFCSFLFSLIDILNVSQQELYLFKWSSFLFQLRRSIDTLVTNDQIYIIFDVLTRATLVRWNIFMHLWWINNLFDSFWVRVKIKSSEMHRFSDFGLNVLKLIEFKEN